MPMNPLFPDDEKEQNKNSYLLPNSKERRLEPASGMSSKDASPAVELIRRKIDTLYDKEPAVREEIANPPEPGKPLSKHQKFMHELSTSGKSLAQIQTEWHEYYVKLPDNEKHEIWQEFYMANDRVSSHYAKFVGHKSGQQNHQQTPPAPPHDEHAQAKAEVFLGQVAEAEDQSKVEPTHKPGKRSMANIKKHVLSSVNRRTKAQIKAKQHLQSLMFGLGLGSLAIIIFLFGFFNERFIVPFIQPSGRVGATPIILSTDGVAPSPNPETIIPKINVQLPTVYDLASNEEAVIQKGLEEGIIHYPNTAVPGQQGNVAYFGHSSNNIFNKGKYKFAFVLLNELVPGDIFYITYNNKVYSYRVFDKKVVNPDETWVLGPIGGKAATATLITCDPPGTSLKRLVVWGEQISPDPTGNVTGPTVTEPAEQPDLPSEGPTLWTRFWRAVTPW